MESLTGKQRPPTILIAEDDSDIMGILWTIVERTCQMRPLAAPQGASALAIARQEMPDAIVIEPYLPGDYHGLDVIRELKADPRTAGIPILMLTTLGDHQKLAAALLFGVDAYIRKPFDPSHLVAKIRELVYEHRQPIAPGSLREVWA